MRWRRSACPHSLPREARRAPLRDRTGTGGLKPTPPPDLSYIWKMAPDLRYPIGRYEPGPPPDAEARTALLAQLAEIPGRLRSAVAGLSDGQLDTPYRSGGWTVRQVVHHLADAHLHWYARTKLAVTEDEPVVMPWDEALWAELEDARTGPLEPSLMLLEGLHRRWAALFGSLTEEQWKRRLVHPERGVFVLEGTLPMCVWHGRHHTAQIAELRRRMGWT
jgi:uncharacterized damage-inducible protein DinB